MINPGDVLIYSFFALLRKVPDRQYPFAGQLIRDVIRDRSPYDAYHVMDEARKAFLHSGEKISITDLGAGHSMGRTHHVRSVKNIVRRSAGKPKYHRLLYRMVRYFKPAVILEAGTSLGLGTLALALAHPEAAVFTLEGDPASAALARKMFDQCHLKNITLLTGPFRDGLPQVFTQTDQVDFIFLDGHHEEKATLEYFETFLPHLHEKSILVTDDIHWSKGMSKAWSVIRQHPQVSLTIDIFQTGLIFFNPALPKQTLIIRY